MGDLKEILDSVQKPGRYVGSETNSVRKPFNADTAKVVLAYPDMYEIGMSYLGLRILYHLLNEKDDILCERVFMPGQDMVRELSTRGRRLFSLESKKDIRDFDILGFSLCYELTYTNVLSILDLGGITVRSDERAEDEPLVIAGGTCCYNPEPMSAFIDAFLIGDGEELLPEFIYRYRSLKKQGLSRKNILKALSDMRGVYVPSLYTPGDSYSEDFSMEKENEDVPEFVERAMVMDLENAYYPVKQIVPLIKIVHDRIAVEIMRGCPNRCRFCQASAVNRPVRVRSIERIREICRESYKYTGNERVALLSLSSVNYPYLADLVRGLNEDFAGKGVGISIPSLRVDESFYELPEMISVIRKAGLTFAPETANENVSRAIGKDIDPGVLSRAAEIAFKNGWRALKLYFMVGFPGEMEDEEKGIMDLAHRISRMKSPRPKGAAEVKVSVNPLIPKPQTPFQWSGMKSREELEAKKNILIAGATRKVKVDFHDIDQSMLEGSLSRGDRRVSDVIYTAWNNGACMDGWSEFFKPSVWKEAFKAHGLDMDTLAQRRFRLDERLPWDHIKAGTSKESLKKEFLLSGLAPEE
jgi:radical SAM family uncharacterized protein